MTHDVALANAVTQQDVYEADQRFYSDNIQFGGFRGFAAIMVKHTNPILSNKQPRLRGTPQPQGSSQARPTQERTRVAVPVSVGSVMRKVKGVQTTTRDGAMLSGTDFLSTVEANGVTTFGLGKSALLSPAYFLGTHLGNMSRSFERYRWKRLRIHYVPKVATSTAGQIILCSSRSVSEPCLAGEAGSFLPRAMSQGNATMGPLWMENYIDIDCSNEWRLVDPASTSDPDDSISEELQVYTQTQSSGQVGYLYAEYSVEFTGIMYQVHSTAIPITTGPGQRVTLADTLAVNNAGDDWSLTDSAGILNVGGTSNGTIYRAVFDLQGSSPSAGTPFSTGFQVNAFSHNSITSLTQSGQVFAVVGGMTFYLVINGSALLVYTSIEAAVTGTGSGQVFKAFATTTVGSYNFDVALIRHGLSVLPGAQ